MPCHGGGPDKLDMLTRALCLLADAIDLDDEKFIEKVKAAHINEEEKWCTRQQVIQMVLKHRAFDRRHKFLRECWKRCDEIPIGTSRVYVDDHGNSFRFSRAGKRGLLWTVYDTVTGEVVK